MPMFMSPRQSIRTAVCWGSSRSHRMQPAIGADGVAGRFGPVVRVGVEGTGSYGVGLSRHLHREGIVVVEVDRRTARLAAGWVSPIRSTLSQQPARAVWVSVGDAEDAGTGPVEQIRVLLVARRSARAQRIATLNQLRQLVICAPDEIRARFKDRYKTGLVSEAARCGPVRVPTRSCSLRMP